MHGSLCEAMAENRDQFFCSLCIAIRVCMPSRGSGRVVKNMLSVPVPTSPRLYMKNVPSVTGLFAVTGACASSLSKFADADCIRTNRLG